jgi:hypothetical protein
MWLEHSFWKGEHRVRTPALAKWVTQKWKHCNWPAVSGFCFGDIPLGELQDFGPVLNARFDAFFQWLER